MISINAFTLILGSTALVFVVAAWLMRQYPPTKINQLYGYRTTNSMKSQDHWDYAQKISTIEFLKAGVILLLLAPLGFFFTSGDAIGSILALIILIIIVWHAIHKTERSIKIKFRE